MLQQLVPWSAVTRADGDAVHVLRHAACAGEGGGPGELVVVDTATAARTVLPAGPGGPEAMVPGGTAATVSR